MTGSDKSVLAVDLGGTNLRVAAVDASGTVLDGLREATPHDPDPLKIVHAIADLAKRCRLGLANGDRVASIGVAVPATMDIANGVVNRSPNLPMLNGLSLGPELESLTGLKVVLENDATSAAIGEHWLGASRDAQVSICVTLGTGVGGGLIINGEPHRGPDGTAGEIGHICVEPNGHLCGCGSWGCIEQYASATAVVRLAEEALARNEVSSLATKNRLTAHDVYDAAMAGDGVASRVFQVMGSYLGLALAGLINTLNPETIVIAGGLSAAWDVFIDQVRDEIGKRAFHEPAARAKLVRAELGDDAGILGVARLALISADRGISER